jgi:hypothetical protein
MKAAEAGRLDDHDMRGRSKNAKNVALQQII